MRRLPQIKVKPKAGLTIRDDKGLVIPPEGSMVRKSIRIMRIVRDGDLEIVRALETKKGKK